MPVTTLDPKAALVIIDLQKGIIAFPTAHPVAGVIAKSAALAEAFRRRGLPVVLVNVAGGAPGRTDQMRPPMSFPPGWTDLAPELNRQPGDLAVTKMTWGAFASTDLEARLKALGVTQVVLTGVSTSIGVESTARQAYELGFNVTLAIDAMTDTRPEAHDGAIAYIFPRLGETGLAEDIIRLLAAPDA